LTGNSRTSGPQVFRFVADRTFLSFPVMLSGTERRLYGMDFADR